MRNFNNLRVFLVIIDFKLQFQLKIVQHNPNHLRQIDLTLFTIEQCALLQFLKLIYLHVATPIKTRSTESIKLLQL